jgi:hypothetical protein
VDSTGAHVETLGGGTQYTEGNTDATITGTALMVQGAADTLVAAPGTAADGLLVNLGANNDVTITGGVSVGFADGTAFVVDSTLGAPISGVYEASPTSCADNDTCIAGLTEGRVLKIAVAEADGTLAEYSQDVQEDVPNASDETGPLVMAVRRDVPTTDVSLTGVNNDGEYATLSVNSHGALWVRELPSATGGATFFNVASAATTNYTNVKADAGTVYSITLINTTSSLYYLRLYNLDAVDVSTCASATGYVTTIPVPASPSGAGVTVPLSVGGNFSTGISYCITGGPTSTDNTAAAVGIYGFVLYQ